MLWQHCALFADLADEGTDEGSQLGGILTPCTVALEIPLGLDSFPPFVSAHYGREVLNGDLLAFLSDRYNEI